MVVYTPPQKFLDKYADVLVNFALRDGKGVKPKQTVLLQVPECAKPMLIALRRKVLEAGAYPVTEYLPDHYAKEYFKLANEDQLKHFPAKLMRGRLDEIDHSIAILADADMHELEGVDPKKIMLKSSAMKLYKDWRDEKENAGKFTWNLALYGTPAMAKEAKMSLKAYWDEIIKACWLDQPDPVAKWKEIFKELERVRGKLSAMKIEKVHVEGKNIDLTIKLGSDRKWLAGSGRNIPSFEAFISPDWRGTEGYIYFNKPLYRYGNLITEIKLEFKKGRVVKATASKNQKVLTEMIKLEGGDKVGEFSLTDSRMSRISKFMAETLFDENVGGKFGNTHIALGSSYQESYIGKVTKVTKSGWEKMGFNNSIVHTDMVSTEDRKVTATLPDGSEKVIYKDGKFVI